MSLVPRIPGHDAALVRTALVDGFVVYCMGDDDPRLDAMNERRLPYVLIDHAAGRRRPDRQHRRPRRRARDGRAPDRARPPPLRRRARLGHPVPTAEEALAGMHYHVDRERLRGWREAIEAAGVDWDAVALASATGFDRETGRDRRRQAARPRRPPDRDRLHLRRARPRRARTPPPIAASPFPEQLSVTGFDDVPDAARAGLTTVRQPHQEKGAAALRLLLGDDAPRPRSSSPPSSFPAPQPLPLPT